MENYYNANSPKNYKEPVTIGQIINDGLKHIVRKRHHQSASQQNNQERHFHRNELIFGKSFSKA